MVRRRQLRDRDSDEREMWIDAPYNDAPWLAQHWYSGQGDPLYALASAGFPQPESTVEWALSNAKESLHEHEARMVKKYGNRRWGQLARIDPQSEKARDLDADKREDLEAANEIDNLVYALEDALKGGERISEEEGWKRHGGHGAREHEAWPHRHQYPQPGLPPHHHVAPRVRDFSTLTEIIEHAMRVDGATHVLPRRSQTKIYYPRGDGQYEEACVWVESGYWHSQAPSDRKLVASLPRDAELIESFLDRGGHGLGQRQRGQHAAEAFGRRQWTDWMILDSIDKGNALPAEAERRALKLAQLGFIDTTGIWRLTAKGRQVVDRRVPVAAEARKSARGSHTVRDYIAVDNHGRTIAGPFTDYGQAKREADRMGGYVRFESKFPPRPHEEELVGEVVAVVATTHPRMLPPPGPMPDGPHRRRRRRAR